MRLCAVFRATLRDVLAAELGDVAVEDFAAAAAAAAFGFVVVALGFAVAVVVAALVEALLLPQLGGEEEGGPGFIWIILRVRVGGGGSVTTAAGLVPVLDARRFLPRAAGADAEAGSSVSAGGGRVNVSIELDCACCVAIWGEFANRNDSEGDSEVWRARGRFRASTPNRG